MPAPSPPDSDHWLGTDDTARDVLARIIYGFRLSVLFAIFVSVMASAIGILVGAVQGYLGGKTDLFAQRLIEIWGATPSLYIIIIVSAIWRMDFWLLVFLMTLFSWTALVGVVRAEFLRARNFEYVQAAKALGVRPLTIMFRHVLPNAMVATLTMLPFIVTGAIGSLAALDFLGFGFPPPPLAWRADPSGQAEPSGTLARHHGIPCLRIASRPACLHLRGCARRLRSAKDLLVSAPLLSLQDLSVTFRGDGVQTRAVRNLSLDIAAGETVALVGESGSGKSVSALASLGLLPDNAEQGGSVVWKGAEIDRGDAAAMRRLRGNEIGMIFQEPMTSLNPLHTIEKQIRRSLRQHQG
ncbi:MAG: hypothetical protein CM15mP115_23100 [Alphaproteobacteria bacterium]|nr:MAG: hypothetical protein CM15mP115_23100 [Alphaproteobacteria bacterium]